MQQIPSAWNTLLYLLKFHSFFQTQLKSHLLCTLLASFPSHSSCTLFESPSHLSNHNQELEINCPFLFLATHLHVCLHPGPTAHPSLPEALLHPREVNSVTLQNSDFPALYP